jgi:signal transduction histidine kinase/CheY-like chemotaxis protein
MITDEEIKIHGSIKLDDSAFRKSIFKIVGIPSIFFITSLIFTHFQFEYRESLRTQKSKFIQLKLNASEYLRLYVDMESAARGYVITKDRDFLEPYNKALIKNLLLEKKIQKSIQSNYRLNSIFNELISKTHIWNSKYADVAIQKIQQNVPIDGNFREASRNTFDQIRIHFNDFNIEIDKLGKKLNKKIINSNKITYYLEIVLIISFIIFMYFLIKKQLALVITSYKEILNQNRKQFNKLLEISKSKDLFLANMSHEIRTPLGAILGFIDLALEDRTLGFDTRGHLNFVKRNGAHLMDLIEDLFDLSKVNTNKINIHIENTDLLEILLDIKNNFSSVTNDNKQNLNFTILGQVPRMISSDSLRLKQILINLLSNAIKFTKINGDINFRLTYQENKLVFDVIDNGIGIPHNMQDKIFNTFQQVENKHSRKYGGAGLGLSISKKLANLMNGNLILVESSLGKGSHFRLEIPFEGESASSLNQEIFNSNLLTNPEINSTNLKDENKTLLLKDKKILLAEDSRENQILFKIYLESEGAKLDIVDSGADAVRSGLKMNYDIILMDIQMPGIDGYEALQLLRESGYLGHIMALTAHAMKGEREKCLKAGFDGYLSKPVNKTRLVQYIVDLNK